MTVDPVDVLESLGYTEREAAFLCLVAAHSGYFLRRQFNYYIDRHKGFLAHRFLEKAHDAGHVETIDYGQGFHVYHLFSKPIYRLVGNADSQNRRRKGDAMVRARLMALDYVLENDSEHYLVSEEERQCFFMQERGVLVETAASGASFSSVFPIAIVDRAQPSTSLVHFAFIDEGLLSMRRFSRYLADMAPLFHELGTFELIYVASANYNFATAEREFRRKFLPLVSAEQRSLRPEWIISRKRRSPLNAQFTTVQLRYSYPPLQRSEGRGSVRGSADGSVLSGASDGVA
ncbi:MAG TPA: hypothetical protein VGD59_05810 [Acidisarcina sp.]